MNKNEVKRTFAGDYSIVAQRFHREQSSIEDGFDTIGIMKIRFFQVGLGQDEDSPFAFRVHLSDEVGDVASLRVDGTVLDAENDGVGVFHVLTNQSGDALPSVRRHP